MRVLLYALIFVLSVCGNALVVDVLLLNRRLRTVTNSFLLSLALSDLMLALCCMPFTLIPNLMGTFVFGEAVCKLMAYLMGTRRVGGRALRCAALPLTLRSPQASPSRSPPSAWWPSPSSGTAPSATRCSPACGRHARTPAG